MEDHVKNSISNLHLRFSSNKSLILHLPVESSADRAKDYNRRADRAMDDYKTQMRYAANADDKAADYLKRAARLLQK